MSETSSFKIEENIPVPVGYEARSDWFIMACSMSEGSSVLLPDKVCRDRLKAGICRIEGFRALTRKTKGGFRVWKVKK